MIRTYSCKCGNTLKSDYPELNEGIVCRCGKVMKFLKTETEPVAEVPCSEGLDALTEVVRDIRKSDCGAWLKDCNGIHRCSEGREKRQELMRLLDKLYKAERQITY
ncbi:hypothetical protein KAR91_85095 [Candidatus Pacearchaeota archaeon]|nr:hypothetical protein [Candidatus Pacearchaeota archaeon]